MKPRLVLILAAFSTTAHAGGSNYGIAPGALANFAGKVTEWPVSTPRFARDPAIAPDGSVYIAVMAGNKVARFDPKTQSFKEWDLPAGHRPHGVLVDRSGTVWTTGNGNGTIGRLDPATGRVVEYKAPPGRGRRPAHARHQRRPEYDLVHHAERRQGGEPRHEDRKD